MKTVRLSALLLGLALVFAGCVKGAVKIDLPGGNASVLLPENPKSVESMAPFRVLIGDPAKSEGHQWRVTKEKVKVNTYLVETDPQFPWGCYVCEFSDSSLKGKDDLFGVARTQMIIPGPYIVKEEKKHTIDGLEAVDVMAEQVTGDSRIEARLIRRDNRIYVAFFEAGLKNQPYPQERATAFLATLKVQKAAQ